MKTLQQSWSTWIESRPREGGVSNRGRVPSGPQSVHSQVTVGAGVIHHILWIIPSDTQHIGVELLTCRSAWDTLDEPRPKNGPPPTSGSSGGPSARAVLCSPSPARRCSLPPPPPGRQLREARIDALM